MRSEVLRSDGFKWTVAGGIIGLIIMSIGVFIMIHLFNKISEVKLDWLLGISVPLIFMIFAWYIKYTDKIKESDIKRIFEEIGRKADCSETKELRDQLHEHKEQDRDNYDRLFEYITSIDHKLDILISKR